LSTKDGNSNFNCERIDGIRGRRTVKWVRNFQEKYSLRRDGLPGKETIAKLLEELWKESVPVETPTETSTETETPSSTEVPTPTSTETPTATWDRTLPASVD
jgi:peptidoglycan hydrolase-like protein with peptidoglycan-binding domain